uniref:Uncharacterized protein n=1 Tax=Rhizophora mucronata TaxID=61149 RepID=A0A2P2JNR3_RHIMU
MNKERILVERKKKGRRLIFFIEFSQGPNTRKWERKR